jgi:queuine tRNA-ribosyltransferase
VETPVFMPVGTRGAVKTVTPGQVSRSGARLILGNTYHLALRPGPEIIEAAGGIHAFMNWPGSVLTDSGGFQVFSLSRLSRVSDEGVAFQSTYDGSSVFFSPAGVVRLQGRIGSDVMMPLDECVPHPSSEEAARRAVDRTVAWARVSREEKKRWGGELFGIVQGGTYPALRRRCAEELCALEFPGYAVGGLSVGEEAAVMEEILADTLPLLPREKPRYVMGVGPPTTLLRCIARGADMFDCVLPTRNARSGYVFTRGGVVRLRNARWAKSLAPIDPECSCATCRGYTRSYLRHLFSVGEVLGLTLATIHNLTYFQDLMAGARRAIQEGRFDAFRKEVEEAYAEEGK